MAACVCGVCKRCRRNEVNRRYRLRHRERLNTEARARRALDPQVYVERKRHWYVKHREQVLRETRDRRAREPEKYAAHTQLNNALKLGHLAKQPCEVCGDPRSEGHHDDYSRPLDVRWLCRKHHVAEHRAAA